MSHRVVLRPQITDELWHCSLRNGSRRSFCLDATGHDWLSSTSYFNHGRLERALFMSQACPTQVYSSLNLLLHPTIAFHIFILCSSSHRFRYLYRSNQQHIKSCPSHHRPPSLPNRTQVKAPKTQTQALHPQLTLHAASAPSTSPTPSS
jgi:hypothetical protein